MLSIIGFVLICFGTIWAATTHNWIARCIGGGIAALGLFVAFY